MNKLKLDLRGVGTILVLLVVVGAVLGILAMGSQMFYFMALVDQQEVGVRFRNGSIYDIVGPGIYSDFGFYVRLERVSSRAISFSVRDEEIITKDKQRIGLVVSGDAFRPDLARKDELLNLWAQYGPIYLNDDLARNKIEDRARQAMKVCVGERTFDDSIIGDARDAIRACIDEQLSAYAESYGLRIENVVVPEVVLSAEVQAALDAIVQSRLATEKAAQDTLKARAEAEAEQARQEGEIRVAQSRIQEETRQQTILAQLEQEKLEAQQAVIQAQKANELLAAEQDLAINRAQAQAAAEKAKADLALQAALAELYTQNPGYLRLKLVEANASALKGTDKVIFVPEGTAPTIVVPGEGLVPTVQTNP